MPNRGTGSYPRRGIIVRTRWGWGPGASEKSRLMPTKDPRVDEYIAKAADFAKPVLKEMRTRVHAACPDCVETVKWSTPAFDYKGAMCGMAAFKAHCMFGFWKAPLVLAGSNPHRRFRNLRSVADLPSKKEMAALIHKAMALNDDGVVVSRAAREKKMPARCPPTSPVRWPRTRKPGPPSPPSARATSANTSSGSRKRSVRKRARSAFRRPSSGSQKESRETGSISDDR